jgi:undecaprenyl-diphosphatase
VGLAFPSGHAFTAVTLYGFFIYLVWSRAQHPVLRSVITAALGGIAVLVAASRVLLRAHWFSDVLGGFTLGLGWLVSCLLLIHVLRRPADRQAGADRTLSGS